MALKRVYQAVMGMSLVVGGAFTIGSLVGSVALTANAAFYSETDLIKKDFEQMQTLIYKIKNQDLHMVDVEEARRVKAKDAFMTIFSRRDNDGTRSKLYRMVSSDLEDDDLKEVLEQVVKEAIEGSKDDTLELQKQSSYFMILHNFMNELKPHMSKYMSSFEQIRDAKIEASDKLSNFRRMKGTAGSESPSKFAKTLIESKKA